MTREISIEEIADFVAGSLRNSVSLIDTELKNIGYLNAETESFATEMIYVGKQKVEGYSASIQVIPGSMSTAWIGLRFSQLIATCTIQCHLKSAEIELRDECASILEATIRTILNDPTNLQIEIGTIGTVYDSICQSVNIGTVIEEAIYTSTLSWLGKIGYFKEFPAS